MNSAQVVTWLSVAAMGINALGSLPAVSQGVKNAITQKEQPADFLQAVEQVAERLNTKPEYLLAVISFESAGSFDPCKKGAVALDGTQATGLIQFMNDTAKELGTSPEKLCRMSQVEQMAYVERYLVQRGFNGGGLKPLYSTVFVGNPNGKGWESDGYHTLDKAVSRIQQEHLPTVKSLLK